MEYQVIRNEGQVRIMLTEKEHSSMPICTIPSYYVNDLEIANGIVEALNKSKIKLTTEL